MNTFQLFAYFSPYRCVINCLLLAEIAPLTKAELAVG